jgi:hypothetical protein
MEIFVSGNAQRYVNSPQKKSYRPMSMKKDPFVELTYVKDILNVIKGVVPNITAKSMMRDWFSVSP